MRFGATPRYFVDTNILVQLARGNGLFVAELESRFALLSGRNQVLVSYVSIAEIEVIASVNRWQEKRWLALRRYLRSMITAPLGGREIIDAYIEVDTYNRQVGRDMGSKNDIWIAATAIVYDAVLLTTDKDFDHLTQIGVQVERLIAGYGCVSTSTFTLLTAAWLR